MAVCYSVSVAGGFDHWPGVFLSMRVSICLVMRKTPGTWKLTRGFVNVLGGTHDWMVFSVASA